MGRTTGDINVTKYMDSLETGRIILSHKMYNICVLDIFVNQYLQ